MTTLSQILEHKIVAILRGMPSSEMIPIANALYKGGIRIMEVTLNSENALAAIEQLSNEMENRMLIGAGTVLDSNDARNAIAAGAKFIISPSLDATVIKTTKDAGLVSIPGAFTPTEIVAAHNFGADIIKIFPCLNAAYIKNILAPLNHIKLIPTGGIHAGNIQEYAASGAVAFGIGSALVYNDTVNEHYLQQLTVKAAALTEALKKAIA